MAALRLDEKVAKFKAMRAENPKFLQEFVAKRFVDNPHCLTLTMTPSSEYSGGLAAQEAAVLEEKVTRNCQLKALIQLIQQILSGSS